MNLSSHLKDYSYNYPEDLVALYPSDRRDASRLLVLERETHKVSHNKFSDLIFFLALGDVLVLNNTRVLPCRINARRSTGGVCEIFLVRRPDFSITASTQGQADRWLAMIKNVSRLKPGEILFSPELKIHFIEKPADNELCNVDLYYSGDLNQILENTASTPLPPYIKRSDDSLDKMRYQTVFAKEAGSVAAPTAGLHFTKDLLQQITSLGVKIVYVTLHVGPGTFLPVRSENIHEHKMHEEYFELSEEAVCEINTAKKNGSKIVAVGTTVTRVLESCVNAEGSLSPKKGTTNIFIYPPYTFKIVDALLTNFHQPESTLLMLVSAFAGREFILNAYAEAIQEKYRLFSYGDATLIL